MFVSKEEGGFDLRGSDLIIYAFLFTVHIRKSKKECLYETVRNIANNTPFKKTEICDSLEKLVKGNLITKEYWLDDKNRKRCKYSIVENEVIKSMKINFQEEIHE